MLQAPERTDTPTPELSIGEARQRQRYRRRRAVVALVSGIREVSPEATLLTVASGGSVKLARQPIRARQADLSAAGGGLAGLTVGPGGALYTCTSAGVYRLAGGFLRWWSECRRRPDSMVPGTPPTRRTSRTSPMRST